MVYDFAVQGYGVGVTVHPLNNLFHRAGGGARAAGGAGARRGHRLRLARSAARHGLGTALERNLHRVGTNCGPALGL